MVCRFRQLAPLDKPHYECYDECKAKKSMQIIKPDAESYVIMVLQS